MEKCEEYSYKVWLLYSAIVIDKVIWVDEGKENKIGIVTGYPTVDTDIEGIVIVGRTKFELEGEST